MRCGLFASRRVSSSSRALLGSTLALASLQRTMSTAIKLNDGRLHPQIGYGTYKVGFIPASASSAAGVATGQGGDAKATVQVR